MRARPMRILVVKTSSMGDVVHTLPAITDIARRHPGTEIDWLVEKSFAIIAQMHPAVREVIPIEFRRWRKAWFSAPVRAQVEAVRSRLRERHYDLVIDFQGLLKSAYWARQARAPVAGYDWGSIKEPLASLAYRYRAKVSKHWHAVDRSRTLAAKVMGDGQPEGKPQFGIAPPPTVWQGPAKPVVFIPCASRPEKLWPEAHWRQLITDALQKGHSLVLLWGSPDEQQRAQRLAQGFDPERVVVPPFLSVADTAGVLASATYVVGLDTGFTHLAAAFGRNTVGIYCDHEPGLAGVTGSARVISLGGKGQVPTLMDVQSAVLEISAAAAASD